MKDAMDRPFRLVSLASLVLLSACCATIAATVSGCATPKNIANAKNLCLDWREVSVSKHDKFTQATASQIEGNNRSRANWQCK